MMVTLCAAIVAGTAVLAQQPPPQRQPAEPRPPAAPGRTPDRTHAPAPGPQRPFAPPVVHRAVLPNGLQVWMVEMHGTPVVDIRAVIGSGAGADPPGRFGLASFTADLLDEGAGTRNALQLAQAIEVLGASLTTTSSFDASVVHLHALASTIDTALPILADVVRHPTFQTADIERVRADRVAGIVRARSDPAAVASLAFARLLFGPTHRYGTSVVGTEATNRTITRQDVQAFYAAHYEPRNTYLLIAGDVQESSMMALVRRTFGGWTNTAVVRHAAVPLAAQPASREIYLIDTPHAAQSQIRIGRIGAARSTPDFFPLDVMNTILGGADSFTSRLNQNLREQHGYAYGANSAFGLRASAGPFLAGAGVQTDKTADAVGEFVREFERIRTPVSDDDLTRARNLEALTFPSDFETTSDVSARLAEMATYHLPDAYWQEYVPHIRAVSAAEVQEAARRYVDPEHVIVVVVGDRSVVEGPLRAAKLGPVHVVPATDLFQ
jgi:predicted Zn-dependent peptidase